MGNLFAEEISGSDRNDAFKKAETYFGKSQLDLALKFYLQCIKGIERGRDVLKVSREVSMY